MKLTEAINQEPAHDRLYKIYNFYTCKIIASHLTREDARELAGPFGNSACVEPMEVGDYCKTPV